MHNRLCECKRFLAVFSGILWPKRRKPVACGAQPRSHPFLEDHGTPVWKPAGRRLAGLIPNRGFPARRGPRAEARVGAVDEASTAAREGACAPRDQPGSEWGGPIPLEIAKNRIFHGNLETDAKTP